MLLDPDAIPETIERVKAQPGRSKVYVFSPDADPYAADFEEIQERVDLVALPEAIYRSLLPVWRTLPDNAPETEVLDV
ncbi:MAG: hypothetical protein IPN71_14945 [Fibrobacteres bacterium]|nr:hypothetical protein [Fibrobacterota bacterium]